MTEITIKNKTYKLGPIKASGGNSRKLTNILNCLSKDESADWISDGYDLIEEAIRNGNSVKETKEALDNLFISLKKDSDFMNAINSLLASFQ